MDIMLSVPEELGTRARQEFPRGLSAIFRRALEEDLARLDAVRSSAGEATDWVLDLETDNGNSYQGRLKATLIVGEDGDQFFVAEDERLIYYDACKLKVHDLTDMDADTLEAHIRGLCGSDEEFVEAMAAIGRDATIDI